MESRQLVVDELIRSSRKSVNFQTKSMRHYYKMIIVRLEVESMGRFGCKLYLVVYLFACFIESNNALYQVSFICLLYSVSFQFVSMHNVLFTMQISFQLYTKPVPNYLSNATCIVLSLVLC